MAPVFGFNLNISRVKNERSKLVLYQSRAYAHITMGFGRFVPRSWTLPKNCQTLRYMYAFQRICCFLLSYAMAFSDLIILWMGLMGYLIIMYVFIFLYETNEHTRLFTSHFKNKYNCANCFIEIVFVG